MPAETPAAEPNGEPINDGTLPPPAIGYPSGHYRYGSMENAMTTRTFLITGTGKGIGLALSHRLARSGLYCRPRPQRHGVPRPFGCG